MGGMPGGGPTPQQLFQMFQNMPAADRDRFAETFGLNPQQLAQVTQMLNSMSPEQFAQMMQMTGGMGGPGGMPGMPGGGGQPPPGANVIQLTQEEMAAVTRLTQLGFTQQEAVQAYLACDKNEESAANLLFDGFGGDGGGMMMGGFPPAAAPAPAPAPAPVAPAATPTTTPP